MDIVRITSNDAPRLRTLRLRALEDAPDAFGSTHEDALKKSMDDWAEQASTLTTFIAISDNTDVGMVRAVEDRTDHSSAWLISMWVAPDHRGRGIGDALIDAVVGWALDGGYARLKLDVADGNGAAIRLYARKGFEPNGEVGNLPPPRDHISEHTRVRELSG